MGRLKDAGIDEIAVNHEMNLVYHSTNVLLASLQNLESLLKDEFRLGVKKDVKKAIKFSSSAINEAEKLYKLSVDKFDENTGHLYEIMHLCMNLDTDEKILKAKSNLKLLIK